jgi:hypothetical protein
MTSYVIAKRTSYNNRQVIGLLMLYVGNEMICELWPAMVHLTHLTVGSGNITAKIAEAVGKLVISGGKVN